MPNGLFLIAKERNRQQSVDTGEAYTEEHDAQWVNDELLRAALCYIDLCLPNWIFNFHDIWPWAEEDWKPKSNIRNLVRAGALIAAEIDRRIALGEEGE